MRIVRSRVRRSRSCDLEGAAALASQRWPSAITARITLLYNDNMSRKPKEMLSFRIDAATAEHLAERARISDARLTDLARRYVEEGLRMDEHPFIYFRESAAGRRPALLGTRLDVADVIETIRASDNDVSDAADYLDVPFERVQACVRYYADYTDEIDACIERKRLVAEREEGLWRRSQAVLG